MPLQERLGRVPLMTIMEVLNKTPPTDSIKNPFYETYLKPELNSLQLWSSDNETLLAQVAYLPGRHMQYQCQLFLHKDIYTLVLEYFPRVFGDKIKQFLIFAQAYTQSSRHATRVGRLLDSTVNRQSCFLVQGFTGLQPLIQQAMQDFGMSYSDYGVKGKGRSEGKGKDKQSSGKKAPTKDGRAPTKVRYLKG